MAVKTDVKRTVDAGPRAARWIPSDVARVIGRLSSSETVRKVSDKGKFGWRKVPGSNRREYNLDDVLAYAGRTEDEFTDLLATVLGAEPVEA